MPQHLDVAEPREISHSRNQGRRNTTSLPERAHIADELRKFRRVRVRDAPNLPVSVSDQAVGTVGVTAVSPVGVTAVSPVGVTAVSPEQYVT